MSDASIGRSSGVDPVVRIKAAKTPEERRPSKSGVPQGYVKHGVDHVRPTKPVQYLQE
jgi:hypothetical protein